MNIFSLYKCICITSYEYIQLKQVHTHFFIWMYSVYACTYASLHMNIFNHKSNPFFSNCITTCAFCLKISTQINSPWMFLLSFSIYVHCPILPNLASFLCTAYSNGMVDQSCLTSHMQIPILRLCHYSYYSSFKHHGCRGDYRSIFIVINPYCS